MAGRTLRLAVTRQTRDAPGASVTDQGRPSVHSMTVRAPRIPDLVTSRITGSFGQQAWGAGRQNLSLRCHFAASQIASRIIRGAIFAYRISIGSRQAVRPLRDALAG